MLTRFGFVLDAVPQYREPPEPQRPIQLSSRKLKNQRYRKIQLLYSTDKSAALDFALDMSNYIERVTPSTVICREWARYLSTRSLLPPVPDNYRPRIEQDPIMLRSLMDPLREEEINWALLSFKTRTAKGLDGVSVEDLKNLRREDLLTLANAFLRNPLSDLLRGRITLIPKIAGPTEMGHFRPICIYPIIVLTIHKILARRLDGYCHHKNQTGFQKGRTISKNIFLLKHILQSAAAYKRSLYVAFLDFRKAFDSIDHRVMLSILKANGFQETFTSYISKIYSDSSIFIGPEMVNQGRGVLQGNPLPPLLFNIVLDYVLYSLNDRIGVTINGETISVLAYADDLVMLASSREGMDQNLQNLTNAGARVGLSLGVDKCASIGRMWLGRQKKFIHDNEPFHLGQSLMPVMNLNSCYKYLGVGFMTQGPKKWNPGQYRDKLSKLSKAPLKPQQKLFLLKNFLVPKFVYQLKHEKVSNGILRSMDKMSRTAIRKFLHLPKDCPTPMLYEHPSVGGLGVPELESVIVDQLAKLKTQLEADEGVWPLVAGSIKIPISNRERIKSVFEFCDGRGLAQATRQLGCYSWINAYEGSQLCRSHKDQVKPDKHQRAL